MDKYQCPKCGRLPHWTAVELGVAVVPVRWDETDPFAETPRKAERRAAIVAISAEICREDPEQR